MTKGSIAFVLRILPAVFLVTLVHTWISYGTYQSANRTLISERGAAVISKHKIDNSLLPAEDKASCASSMDTYVPYSVGTYLEKERNCRMLIYNPVPKCASLAIRATIDQLASTRNYNSASMKFGVFFRNPNITEQAAVAREISELPRPVVFNRHMHFLDFSRFGLQTVSYFNVVRDPIDRLISWFYYKKFQGGKIEDKFERDRLVFISMYGRNWTQPTFKYTQKEFDECVQSGDPSCMLRSEHFTIVPWFCGHHDFCVEETRRSLEAAKHNVVHHHPVVGYVENLPELYAVLEAVWPQFFTGFTGNATKMMEVKEHKGARRKPVLEETRNILRAKMGLEYEFYHFIKQRFNCLKTQILK